MSILSSLDIARIHDASLNLLETIGVKIDHSEVCRRLVHAGAESVGDSLTIRFPRDLVASFISKAPRNIHFADRCGKFARVGANGGTVFWGGNAMYIARGPRSRADRDGFGRPY